MRVAYLSYIPLQPRCSSESALLIRVLALLREPALKIDLWLYPTFVAFARKLFEALRKALGVSRHLRASEWSRSFVVVGVDDIAIYNLILIEHFVFQIPPPQDLDFRSTNGTCAAQWRLKRSCAGHMKFKYVVIGMMGWDLCSGISDAMPRSNQRGKVIQSSKQVTRSVTISHRGNPT